MEYHTYLVTTVVGGAVNVVVVTVLVVVVSGTLHAIQSTDKTGFRGNLRIDCARPGDGAEG